MSMLHYTAIALAIALPGIASAQTAAPATTPGYVNLINDDSITARLQEDGYENISIARSGNTLTIDATKDGTPTNLVYDLSTGALTAVDGAGYAIETAAPGVTEGDAQEEGKTDQAGSDATSEPKGGTDGNDTGTSGEGSNTTEPSDGGKVAN